MKALRHVAHLGWRAGQTVHEQHTRALAVQEIFDRLNHRRFRNRNDEMIDMHHTRRIPQRNASQWTVLCDFDGTIAVDDVTDSLLLRFGRPGWEMLEAAWRDGRIDARACMSA